MTDRCKWCQDNGVNQKYHDEEWGIPVHDDQKHFEFLMMEVMQCGLNWTMMLNKRETFRLCFDNFDFNKIARYTEDDIERILATPNMIKSRRKINAVITNARAFEEIIAEHGSFDSYLWQYTGGETLVYLSHQHMHTASNEISDKISADLKKRGFKYLGSITVYSHLQASGLINDHEESCFLYQDICCNYPIRYLD